MDRRAFIIGAASATAVACSRATTSPQSGATPGKGVVATNDGVTLRYEEGLTYTAMEEICGERSGTLQARVARAIDQLRRCLQKKGAL